MSWKATHLSRCSSGSKSHRCCQLECFLLSFLLTEGRCCLHPPPASSSCFLTWGLSESVSNTPYKPERQRDGEKENPRPLISPSRHPGNLPPTRIRPVPPSISPFHCPVYVRHMSGATIMTGRGAMAGRPGPWHRQAAPSLLSLHFMALSGL